MQVTVNTTPQAIFPYGEQDALVIRNDGPSTVFVDSDSAINDGGHAVPPTGVLAWDANRPLWMVASDVSEGTATVTLTRNSQAAAFTNFLDNVLYENYESGNQPTRLIETSAYSRLIVRVVGAEIMANSGVAIGGYVNVTIAWYDSKQNFLSRSVATCYPYIGNSPTEPENHAVRMVFPVKGAYASIQLSNNITTLPFLRVIGSTRDIPLGQAFMFFDENVYNIGAGGPVGSFVEQRAVSLDLFGTGVVGWTLAIPNLGPLLTIGVGVTANPATTVAGQYSIRDVRDGNIIVAGVQNIPVGTSFRADVGPFSVPLWSPLAMTVTLPTPIGNVTSADFHLTWHDA